MRAPDTTSINFVYVNSRSWLNPTITYVGIQPAHVGLVAADDRTRAKHQFKFRAVGSSTQAFCHSFAVRTVGDWNSASNNSVTLKSGSRVIQGH